MTKLAEIRNYEKTPDSPLTLPAARWFLSLLVKHEIYGIFYDLSDRVIFSDLSAESIKEVDDLLRTESLVFYPTAFKRSSYQPFFASDIIFLYNLFEGKDCFDLPQTASLKPVYSQASNFDEVRSMLLVFICSKLTTKEELDFSSLEAEALASANEMVERFMPEVKSFLKATSPEALPRFQLHDPSDPHNFDDGDLLFFITPFGGGGFFSYVHAAYFNKFSLAASPEGSVQAYHPSVLLGVPCRVSDRYVTILTPPPGINKVGYIQEAFALSDVYLYQVKNWDTTARHPPLTVGGACDRLLALRMAGPALEALNR